MVSFVSPQVASWFGAAAMEPGDWKFFQSGSSIPPCACQRLRVRVQGYFHCRLCEGPLPPGCFFSALWEWSADTDGGCSGTSVHASTGSRWPLPIRWQRFLWRLSTVSSHQTVPSIGQGTGDKVSVGCDVGVSMGASVRAFQAKATARVDVPETPSWLITGWSMRNKKSDTFLVFLRTLRGKHCVFPCHSDMLLSELV